ncbi:MAG: hypothetical protein PVF45_13920 [Anaerolineae bacterium]
METEKRKPRIRDLAVSMVLALVGLIWLGIAVPDQDWLWFLPIFNERAARIHLYRDGEELVLYPGDAGYEEINEAVNEIVRHIKAKDSLGISLESLEEYYMRYSAVEVFYPEPVIIHTSHGFPKADKYLFPQSGRHYDPPVVFAGFQTRIEYRGGVLVLEDRERLDRAADIAWTIHERE